MWIISCTLYALSVIALTDCEDPNDPQYAISKAAFNLLSQTRDAKGRQLEIIKLPLPGPLLSQQTKPKILQESPYMNRQVGERLAASYANFLICNNGIVFPLLDEKTDEQATTDSTECVSQPPSDRCTSEKHITRRWKYSLY